MTPGKSRYERAIELWQEWNAKINVISRKDTDHIFEHHILHSLAIAEYFERYHGDGAGVPLKTRATLGTVRGGTMSEANGGVERSETVFRGSTPTVLDLGTGGGFPGIPLAMEWPEVQFTLCDSIGKKVTVAQAVAEGLELKNVECVKARAEELPGEWDWVVSRAVAPLDSLYGWVKGRFRRGLVCLKGGDINEEIAILLKKYRLSPKQIRTWKISDWLDDEYFAEKFVIEVGKSYLCSPFVENIK